MNSERQRTRYSRPAAESSHCEDLIVELRNISLADRNHVGTKSATLGELMKVGFDVPEGFVLTTEAFPDLAHQNRWPADASMAESAHTAVPPRVVAALRAPLAVLGDVPVAVRSSAVEEDLGNASFAGIYDTVLGVRGLEAVSQAVQNCWNSVFGQRAAVYRAMKGLNGAPRMAVLVQRLVAAEASGIAFTAHPLTGDTSVTLVNAVAGLGESIVSGRTTPEEWLVAHGQATCEASYKAVLDATKARRVAELAERIEVHLGCPQDIEWALSQGRLYLLQARPITAL